MPRKGSKKGSKKKNSNKGGKKPTPKQQPKAEPIVAAPAAEPIVAAPAGPAIAKPDGAKHPMIKWAETTDAIFMTLEVSDCPSPEIKISEDNVCFLSKNKDGAYYCDLKLKNKVDTTSEDTKWTATDRDVQIHLVKKEPERWEGLLENRNLGRNLVKPDFDKWVDSDDEEKDAGGFDTSQFGGAGGMGGMGGGMPGMGGMGGGMPGMGGMGGMPGMGGGMPGMGGGMPGMGGEGGMGGMDMAKMMEMMKGMKEGGDMGDLGGDEDGDDDDDLPDLEDAEEQ